MENKVRFDGVILNEPKLTEFNSTLIRLQNKQDYTKKDGTPGQSSCTVTVSAMGNVAQEVVSRFKRGEIVRVEGSLQLKKTKNLDQEGREIYETWIKARSVNVIPGSGIIKKPIEERMGFKSSGPAYIPKEIAKDLNQHVQLAHTAKLIKDTIKQPTPTFKKTINQPQAYQEPILDDNPFEEVFENTLPF
jgi:single-stranded DNA-binding protein